MTRHSISRDWDARSEPRFVEDPAGPNLLIRWTDSPANDQALYFTCPSVTLDDRYLFFLSDRDGGVNLWRVDRRTGSLARQTDSDAGPMKAYVYPCGEAQRGVSKSSPCLHAPTGRLAWVQDQAVWRRDLEDKQPVRVVDLPTGWLTGFTHIDPAGRWLCVPIASPGCHVDPATTQVQQMQHVVRRFCRGGLVSRLLVIDLTTGHTVHDRSVPFWVTHVQFHPRDPTRMIFNMEGGGDAPLRVWRWDLERDHVQPLFPQIAGDWVCHENWSPDGQSILIHGSPKGQKLDFAERRAWDGALLARTTTTDIRIGHLTPGSAPGPTPAATPGPTPGSCIFDSHDGWIYRWHEADDRIERLVQHGSSFNTQDNHPHPLVTPSGRGISFTSDRDGAINVYELVLNGR
jgi:WD40 repeat protein